MMNLMNLLGFTHRSRMHTFGQAMLWSGIAIGASLWLMKEYCPSVCSCHCGSHTGENTDTCGCQHG